MKLFCIALVMVLGGSQALAASPKSDSAPMDYAGAHDQATPVLLSVPSRPVAFRGSDGLTHLDYELQVTNARAYALKISSLEILDSASGKVLATFSGASVSRTFSLLGGGGADTLGPAQTGFFWIDVAMVAGEKIPRTLSHRVVTVAPEAGLTAGSTGNSGKLVETTQTGGLVAVSPKPAIVLGPPLEGRSWIAFNGCCSDATHRRAGIAVNGTLFVSQRFAIDWIKMDSRGQIHSGDNTKNENWPTYGQKAIAVMDGKVVSVLDGLPERVANALPSDTTMQNVTGNHVILDLGQGRYGFYAHLQPGSLKVRVGDRVKRGQVLALVGNSGNTSGPHLHFHVSDGMGPLSAQGLPYVIDTFRASAAVSDVPDDGKVVSVPLPAPGARRGALPMNGVVVDFPSLK